MYRRQRKSHIQEIDVVVSDGKVIGITLVYNKRLNEVICIDILYNSNRLKRCYSLNAVPKKYKNLVQEMLKEALA